MIALRLEIRGKVQGVSFRESMRQEATRLGITGWVRNRKDTSVEAWIQGDEKAVAELAAWADVGPELANVSQVKTEKVEPDPLLKTFVRKETV